jgi:hypothetical protein
MNESSLVNEVAAYRDLLSSGKLTELDMDGLCQCLREVVAKLSNDERKTEDTNSMRTAIQSDVLKLFRASCAFKTHDRRFDDERLQENLDKLTAAHLIEVRRRAALLLSSMLRSSRLPHKTASRMMSDDSVFRDYMVANGGSGRPQ